MGGQHLTEILNSFARGCGLESGAAAQVASHALTKATTPLPSSELADFLVFFAACCGAEEHRSIYVGTPITTGPAFLEWRRRYHRSAGAGADQARAELVEANRAQMRRVIRTIRQELSTTVIDPSALVDIRDWEQRDYHSFWVKIIKTYAYKVAFVDGWQYSEGCSIEFATAVALGIPTLTERLTPLPYSDGIRLLGDAIEEFRTVGPPPQQLIRSFDAALDAVGRV